MKELKGETKIIITDLTLDAILKMFKTPEEKESFQKCWEWGLIEWKPLTLCKDCKYIDRDLLTPAYWCTKLEMTVGPDFYCKCGEAK